MCERLIKFLVLLTTSLTISFQVNAKISGQQIAVIVNTQDSDSVLIAEYYQKKRNIPSENIIRVSLPADKYSIDKHVFNSVYQQVKSETPMSVQFYAIAWSKPYRVGCMSVTSAFTFGFDSAYCAKKCQPTKASPYFNSNISFPYDELGMRPSMLLAGSNLQQVYDLIDRGVAADSLETEATAYLLSTSDKKRNVRAIRYPMVKRFLSEKINIELIMSNALTDRDDVMFYFTGSQVVKEIETNEFIPGAMADHLTSAGGRLFDSTQMSILRWLDGGATASYGAVVEPCSFPQKFPDPGVAISRYTSGESLIESYWKSVAWPGQGVFVGEPMASPFASENRAALMQIQKERRN